MLHIQSWLLPQGPRKNGWWGTETTQPGSAGVGALGGFTRSSEQPAQLPTEGQDLVTEETASAWTQATTQSLAYLGFSPPYSKTEDERLPCV